uniref:uncharacterized protein isoform X2 n=1 Tax=Myxine glutinosa TaxID=7769 RepID=UPI00358E0782
MGTVDRVSHQHVGSALLSDVENDYLFYFFNEGSLEDERIIVNDLSSIIYSMLRPYFLAFQVEGLHMGLNFACEDEAKTFEAVWKHSIKDPKSSAPWNEVISFLSPNFKFWRSPMSKVLKSGKRRKGKKVNKVDIGLPSNFQHVEHVGPESRAYAALGVFLSPWTLCDDLNLELKQRLSCDRFSLRSVQQHASNSCSHQEELLRPSDEADFPRVLQSGLENYNPSQSEADTLKWTDPSLGFSTWTTPVDSTPVLRLRLDPVPEVDSHSEKDVVNHALVEDNTNEDVMHKPGWPCVEAVDYFETASLSASNTQHHDVLKETTNLKLQPNKPQVEERQAVTPSLKDGIIGLCLEAMNRRKRVFQHSDSSDEECGEDDEWD